MIWAVIKRGGEFTIHFDDPSVFHKANCKDAKVHQLEREPDVMHGERIDYDSGEIVFDITTIQETVLSEIKKKTAELIYEVSPEWKQRNDIRKPSPEGESRFDEIDRLRESSNLLEDKLATIDSTEALISFRESIDNGYFFKKGKAV